MHISIVIPTFQEADTIEPCLVSLACQTEPFDVFVADGASTDGTRPHLTRLSSILPYPFDWGMAPERGRGLQCNWGADRTVGETLLFLHADTRLPPNALADLRVALARAEVVGGRFDLGFDTNRWPYPLMARVINIRTRLVRRFTGDMGIFVRRSVFDKLDGFPAQPLMEDLEFSARLFEVGEVAALKTQVVTAARRWQKRGVWRTIALMQLLRGAYALGVSPERLADWYRPVR
ncbi:MAG: TIGR04283 family arsenosugar biosynthesis glycosyltransferase [Gemmatimonadaceae bacterium]|nr:TIGR04283 family arsenosugar biosynthesis glycosyltransferase [Gloeobacterales cyanobacterium ES-bin-141]